MRLEGAGMLRNLSLRTRLIGGFLLVATLCAFLGIFSVVRLRTLDSAYSRALDENTKNLEAMAEMQVAFVQAPVDVMRAFSFDRRQRRGELRSKVEASKQRLLSAVAAHETTLKTDDPEY